MIEENYHLIDRDTKGQVVVSLTKRTRENKNHEEIKLKGTLGKYI